MELYLNRFDTSETGTTGLLYIEGKPYCFTVERPWLNNKRSISCIPEGKYKLKFREEPTPLTMRYRQKYDFFNFHLELQDVKDRSGIYIHVGNRPTDVKGCIAVAGACNEIGSHQIIQSRKVFKKLYLKLSSLLDRGESVTIVIDSKRI